MRVETNRLESSLNYDKAKMNALFALKEALSQLQIHAAPDQRITATGSLWESPGIGKGNYVGVWDQNGDFNSWLVSRTGNDAARIRMIQEDLPITFGEGNYNVKSSEYALLLGKKSVVEKEQGKEIQGVACQKKSLGDSSNGKYAWWIGDEGVKAKLNVTDPYSYGAGQVEKGMSVFEKAIYSSRSFKGIGVNGLDAFQEFDSWSGSHDEKVRKIINFDQLGLIGIQGNQHLKHFHDLTTHSFGLLTDTKNGGLKKDLTRLFEQEDSIYEDPENPFYTFLEKEDLMYQEAPGPKTTIPLIFQKSVPVGNGKIYGPSWDLLRDYYRLYKGIQNRASQPTLREEWVHSFYPGKAWFYKNASNSDPGDAWAKTLGVVNWRNGSAINSPEANKELELSNNYWNQKSPLRVVRPTKGSYYPHMTRYSFFASTVSKSNGTGFDMDIVLQPFIVMHNPYNVTLETPKMRILTENAQVGMNVRRGGSGWSTAKVFKDGNLSNQASKYYGNMYRYADSNDPKKKYLTHSSSVLSGSVTTPQAFANNTQELIFNIPETSYDPGELKLFVANSKTSFKSREVDLQLFGGNYNPSDGVYLEIDQDDPYYVDHDGDNNTPRRNLLQGIPAGSDISMKFEMSNWITFGTEIWNEDLNEYDTAVSYYKQSSVQDGDNVSKEPFSTLTAETVGEYAPYLDFVENYSTNPMPQFVLDIFLKPCNFNESLIDSSNYTQRQKTFPNYIMSNPLAASISVGALASDSANGSATIERSGLGNMYQVTNERFVGSEGLNSIQELFDADTGSWGNDVGRYGSKRCIMLGIPLAPLESIGDLQHASLNPSPYYPALSIGQSFPSPYLKSNNDLVNYYTTFYGGTEREFVFYDQNFLINEALWDRYFFSTLAPNPSQSSFSAKSPSQESTSYSEDLLNRTQKFIGGETHLQNTRMKLFRGNTNNSEITEHLLSFEKAAANLKMEGAFNINSTSVEAWACILSGYRNSYLAKFDDFYKAVSPDDEARFPKTSISGAYESDTSTPISNPEAWNGFLTLSEDEIFELAEAIVNQIRKRSQFKGSVSEPVPFLSLADFVNRIPSNHPEFGNSGLLQSAINSTKINKAKTIDGTEFNAVDMNQLSFTNTMKNRYPNADYSLNSSLASPTSLTQGDLLKLMGASISPRSDTFRIRAYGEHAGSSNLTSIVCEAIVQRVIQKEKGAFDKRAFQVLSFKWISNINE